MTLALIPCRLGSKRLPGKNFKTLGGRSLYLWTVSAALGSLRFDKVLLCTDADLAPPNDKVEIWTRPRVPDDQADIEWVTPVLEKYGEDHSTFAILRPTSPFRTAYTIRRAFSLWDRKSGFDSLRSVRQVGSPHKMWTIEGGRLRPLLEIPTDWDGQDYPWSSPSQTLPAAWTQTGGLEIAWVHTALEYGSISGRRILPFEVSAMEAVNIDSQEDWWLAEKYLQEAGE